MRWRFHSDSGGNEFRWKFHSDSLSVIEQLKLPLAKLCSTIYVIQYDNVNLETNVFFVFFSQQYFLLFLTLKFFLLLMTLLFNDNLSMCSFTAMTYMYRRKNTFKDCR